MSLLDAPGIDPPLRSPASLFPNVFDQEVANVDLAQEYVTSLSYGPAVSVNIGKRRLPRYIDDLERKVRYDIYELMWLDPQIKSCIGLYIAGILGGGMDVLPASEEDDPSYALDKEVAGFVRDVLLKHIKTPMMSVVLPDMLRAIMLGYRVAEKTYFDYDESPVPGKLVLKYAKIKPRRSVALVVDEYMNVVGICAPPRPGQVETQVLPREKFALLTWKPVDSDPRGTSDGRAAYEPWWAKQLLRPDWLKYLKQFGSPSLIGKTASASLTRPMLDPKTGAPLIDSRTGKLVLADSAGKFLAALKGFQSSSVIVIPYGAELDIAASTGEGAAFINALDCFNMEIAKAILYATLATEQGPNQGRAASSTHADMVSVGINHGITLTEDMVRNDFAAPLVALNYPTGTKVPLIRLPGANMSDFLAWASAVAKLQTAQYLDPSQYEAIDTLLNLPRRSDKAVKELVKAASAKRKLQAQDPAAAANPIGDPAMNPGSDGQASGGVKNQTGSGVA